MANPIQLSDLFNITPQDAEALLGITNAIKGLSGSYKQFAKNLDGDGQKVAGALAALTTQTAALKAQMGNINVASDQERAGYAALSASLGQLFQDQQRLLAAEKGIASTRKATTESTRVLTSELRLQQQALKDAFAAGNTEGIRKAAAEILLLKANSEDLNRALRGANSIYTAAAGSYRAMENEARLLGTQLKALEAGVGSNVDEVQQLKARLADVNAALIKFGRDVNDGHANVGRYAESIMEAVGSLTKQRAALLASATALRTQAQATDLSTGEQQHLQTELAQTEAELLKVNGQLSQYGVHVQQGSGATSLLSAGAGELAQTLLGAYAGIQGVTTAVQQAFEANVTYSRELAEVRKTTGLTADEAEHLAESLKLLDTPTSLSGLLKIASVGGQLGITKDNLLDFTKAIDTAVQALGNDFTGGADEIATTLGRLSSVFSKELGPDQAKNILAVGSAINQIAADGSSDAPFLADVALRVGAISTATGVGLKNVLAYAAVLQEQGYSAEASGTALNRLFSTLTTRSKEAYAIAKIANPALTLKEFRDLINNDFPKAIDIFFKGLTAGGQSTTALSRELATLKLQSGEAKSVIVTLAQNTELFAERQKTANDQLRDATSLAAEAAINTDTLAGSYDKLKNNLSAFFTTGRVATFFKGIIDFAKDGIFYQEKLTQSLAQTTQKTVGVGVASQQAAAGTQALLATYTSLSGKSTLSATEQQRLATTVLALKDRLGESAVTINQQTGAFELNTAAVQKAITASNELATAQATTLARQLQGLNEQRKQTQELEAALSQSADTRSKQVVDIASPDQLARIQRYLSLVKEGSYLAAAGLPVQVTKEQVEQVKGLQAETEKLSAAGLKLQKIDGDRAILLAGLKKLHLDEAGALALIGDATTKNTKKTDDDVEADKKKKQSTADVAKEEFELQKQRLQARVADLDRQADNPANSEALRTAALAKGVQVRQQLAELERDEQIREVTKTNKDKIDGDQATAVARVRLTEAYQEALQKTTRDSDTKLVALRNMLLNQLGELDKVSLESEITAAEKVRDNVNKSYDERQKAARETAHAQIELAALVRDTEVRNALGALDKIELANKKYEDARAKASVSVKVYDSSKAIDEQDATYARLLLATEDLHGKQLTSEKTYLREVRDLENQREAEAIAALEAEYGETADVLRRKAALRKKLNGEELKDEDEKEQKRAQIIQAAVEKVQAISGAYFDFQSAKLQAAEANEQTSYDNSIKAAGDNVQLKAKIEADHAKKVAAIKRKEAENDRNSALFTIAINTALAVSKSLADFGLPIAIPFMLADVVVGGLQAAAVLAKPIPQYFKGRQDGPAEFANLAERGPELVGRPGSYRLLTTPTVGYLNQGDRVIPAAETQQLLQQHSLVAGQLLPQPAVPQLGVAGRLQFQREQADMERSATRLMQGNQQQAVAQRAAQRADNQALLQKLDRVEQAVKKQEYYRLSEQDDLVRRQHRDQGWRDVIAKRYRGGRPAAN